MSFATSGEKTVAAVMSPKNKTVSYFQILQSNFSIMFLILMIKCVTLNIPSFSSGPFDDLLSAL